MSIDVSMIDDNLPAGYAHPHAPYDLGVAMGQYGQYLMVSPSEKLVIISMGYSYPTSSDCWKGYNEAFMTSLIWGMLSPTLQASAEHVHSASAEVVDTPRTSTGEAHVAKPVSSGAEQHSEQVVGSCMCDCSRLGFGLCFNVEAAMGIDGKAPSDCKVVNGTLASNSSVGNMIQTGAGSVCPVQGFTLQCDEGQTESRCSAVNANQTKACGPVENMPSSFQVETCARDMPQQFSPCVWHPVPCHFGEYYPEWKPSQASLQHVLV